MKLSELLTYIRKVSPLDTVNKISDADMTFLLNEALKEVCVDAKLFVTDILFNIVAEQSEYSINTIDNRIIGIESSGVYWNNGTIWIQLHPVTKKYLDEKTPSWRDIDSGNPYHYFIEGDILTLYPTPDTSLSDGGKLDIIRRPILMASNNDQPFHTESDQSVQIARYDIFSWSIIDKTKVYLYEQQNEQDKALKQEQLYYTNLKKRLLQINVRNDINYTRYAQMGQYYAPDSF